LTAYADFNQSQDHYAVLGLSKYRYIATDEQIKNATRKKVLKHHPDKKAAAGLADESDSFFKCIQRANEILLDPKKRRQYDSVDVEADVEPPTKKEMQKPSNFYKKWGPVFESEARFSNRPNVPKLGDDNSAKEEVEAFYDFWFNFDSWRSFEYQDEDVPDDNEGRDHKRHIEKKNANARKKKKTEDTARLRKVVDDALSYDPRIKKFQQEGRANKNKKRLEKEAAAKKDAEEKQKAKEAEERKKQKAEEAAKAEKADSKKAKEAAKNAVKKNKRVVKGSVKDVNYFAAGDASASQIDEVLGDAETMLAKVDADELAAWASKLSIAGKDREKVKMAYLEEVERLESVGKLKDGELRYLKKE
jgi:DnaJ family protein C protein 2